jgi:hypothetical protein
MNEAVRTAALGRDETITFGGVEEFDGADRHEVFPFTKTKGILRRKNRKSHEARKGRSGRFGEGRQIPSQATLASSK